MPELRTQEEFKYSVPETSNKASLGKLIGPCADIINCTRNGRKYSDRLWKRVMQDELVKEQFENGGIFGELGHPETRLETDMEKIAVCMPKPPVEDKQGHLVGTWDILNTPNGRILKTLVDYGYKVGVSSRGDGEVYDTDEGEEVDPDSYILKAFDIVIIPAVKAARLEALKESIGGKTLKQTLLEMYNNSTTKEKSIMDETLDSLNIKLTKKECTNSKKDCADIKEETTEEEHKEEKEEAIDDGATEILKCLQEALKQKKELETVVLNLQNQLAVSDTKVERLNEDINQFKNKIKDLSIECQKSKDLESKVAILTENLNKKEKTLNAYRERTKALSNTSKEYANKCQSLNESIASNSTEVKQLKESLNASNDKVAMLQLQLDNSKDRLINKVNEFNQKITKANELIESYKSTITQTMERYIESKAIMLGLTSQEIKNRLSESYTMGEVDKVCDDLQQYTLNINSLPFNVGKSKVKKVVVTESKNDRLSPINSDDIVDEGFLKLFEN